MRVMPNGQGSMSWIPQKTDLVKTAGADGEVVEAETLKDSLYEAAQKVVANMGCCTEESDGGLGGVPGDGLGGDDFGGGDALGDSDAVDFGGDVNEVAEEATGEEAAVEALETAKDAIETAVVALGGDEAEIEVDIEEEVCDDGSCDDLDVAEDDLVVEGDKDLGHDCSEVPKKDCCSSDDEEVVEASTDDWVKVAKLSPTNRKKVVDFWANKLNYPRDYVKLMVKDYEK